MPQRKGRRGGTKAQAKARQKAPVDHPPLFSEDEKVLCYEPDQKKAQVLYDSKVLEVVERKEGHGKVFYEYKIHFQGWNSSWDRYVREDNVLKDTDENRNLQKELHEKAQSMCKPSWRKKNKRKTIMEKLKEVAQAKDANGGVVYIKEEKNDSDVDQEVTDQDSSDDETESQQICIPENLKRILELDNYFCDQMKKLVVLPSRWSVTDLFESYITFVGRKEILGYADRREKAKLARSVYNPKGVKCEGRSTKLSLNTSYNGSIRSDTDIVYEDLMKTLKRINFSKKIVDDIRVMFDFLLDHMLLYKHEKAQFKLLYSKDFYYYERRAACCKDVAIYEAETDVELGAPVSRNKNPNAGKIVIKEEVVDEPFTEQEIKEEPSSETEESLPKRRKTEESQQKQKTEETPKQTKTKESQHKQNTEETPKRTKTEEPMRKRRKTEEPISKPVKTEILDETMRFEPNKEIPTAGPSRRTTRRPSLRNLGLRTSRRRNKCDPEDECEYPWACAKLNRYMDGLMRYTLLPDVHNPEEDHPSVCYGIIHLLRLFVKMPEILSKTSITRKKLKCIVGEINNILMFFSESNEFLSENEWFKPTSDKYSPDWFSCGIKDDRAKLAAARKGQVLLTMACLRRDIMGQRNTPDNPEEEQRKAGIRQNDGKSCKSELQEGISGKRTQTEGKSGESKPKRETVKRTPDEGEPDQLLLEYGNLYQLTVEDVKPDLLELQGKPGQFTCEDGKPVNFLFEEGEPGQAVLEEGEPGHLAIEEGEQGDLAFEEGEPGQYIFEDVKPEPDELILEDEDAKPEFGQLMLEDEDVKPGLGQIIFEGEPEPSELVVEDVKPEPNQLILEEVKSEPGEYCLENVKSEPDDDLFLENVKSEPDDDLFLENVKSEPGQMLLENVKSKPNDELFLVKVKSEPNDQPFLEAVKTEPDDELFLVEVKSEPSDELFLEAVKTEPDDELFLHQVKSEPDDAKCLYEEVKSEPDDELFLEQIQSEPDDDVILVEVKNEPEDELLLEEVKSEPDDDDVLLLEDVKSDSDDDYELEENPITEEIQPCTPIPEEGRRSISAPDTQIDEQDIPEGWTRRQLKIQEWRLARQRYREAKHRKHKLLLGEEDEGPKRPEGPPSPHPVVRLDDGSTFLVPKAPKHVAQRVICKDPLTGVPLAVRTLSAQELSREMSVAPNRLKHKRYSLRLTLPLPAGLPLRVPYTRRCETAVQNN